MTASSLASQKGPSDYDTIVIGAGMSGLACASKLSDHPSYQNDKSLLVLEARDRIGGRIGSVNINGNRLDTGANWIHGVGTKEDPNPLVGVLPHKKFRQLEKSVNFRAPPESLTETPAEDGWVKVDAQSATKDPTVELVVPSQLSKQLFGLVWGLMFSLHEKASNTEECKNTTILKTIMEDEEFRDAFDRTPKEYQQTLRALPQFVENMEAGPLTAQSAEHDADKPGMGMLEYALDDFDGDQVFLKDGYTAVVEEVGKKVKERGQLKLGVEVEQISWNGTNIAISTNTGNYTARKVVSTLPLGVLQHLSQRSSDRSLSLFEPALPNEKMAAIQSLGFGTLDKIFLVFDKPWWKEEPFLSTIKKGIVSINGPDESSDSADANEPDSFWGFTDELPGIEVSPTHGAQPGVRALSAINLHALTGVAALSAFVSCANAVHVESLSDEEAGMIVLRSLSRWFGRDVPKPDAVHVTRWAGDKYSLGSYTHMITGVSETKHREEFQKPLVNEHGAELRFAGEHTSTNHFATVHGALLSGWREADAVLKSEEFPGTAVSYRDPPSPPEWQS